MTKETSEKPRNATRGEIKAYLRDQGADLVSIRSDGRITFRKIGTNVWFNGRWTEEYKMTQFGVIHQ